MQTPFDGLAVPKSEVCEPLSASVQRKIVRETIAPSGHHDVVRHI